MNLIYVNYNIKKAAASSHATAQNWFMPFEVFQKYYITPYEGKPMFKENTTKSLPTGQGNEEVP